MHVGRFQQRGPGRSPGLARGTEAVRTLRVLDALAASRAGRKRPWRSNANKSVDEIESPAAALALDEHALEQVVPVLGRDFRVACGAGAVFHLGKSVLVHRLDNPVVRTAKTGIGRKGRLDLADLLTDLLQLLTQTDKPLLGRFFEFGEFVLSCLGDLFQSREFGGLFLDLAENLEDLVLQAAALLFLVLDLGVQGIVFLFSDVASFFCFSCLAMTCCTPLS